MEEKQINKNIKTIKASTGKVNDLIQTTAVGILEHAKAHNDVTAALRLVQAMPVSFRRDYLVNWFAYFGNIGLNVNKGDVRRIKRESKRFRDVGDNGYDIEGAKANPWHNPDSVPGQAREVLPDTLLEFDAKIISFVERMKKMVQDDERFGDPENPERTENMRANAIAQLDQIAMIANKGQALSKAEVLETEAAELRRIAEAA